MINIGSIIATDPDSVFEVFKINGDLVVLSSYDDILKSRVGRQASPAIVSIGAPCIKELL